MGNTKGDVGLRFAQVYAPQVRTLDWLGFLRSSSGQLTTPQHLVPNLRMRKPYLHSLKMPSSQQKETTLFLRTHINKYMCIFIYIYAFHLPLSQNKPGLGNIIFDFRSSHVSRHTHEGVWTPLIQRSDVHISLYLHTITQTKEMKSAGIEPAIAAIESAKIYAL